MYQEKASGLLSISGILGVLVVAASMASCTSKTDQGPGPAALTDETPMSNVVEIVLPVEDAVLRDSTLAGRQLAEQKCTICHSVDYIQYQPPGMDLEQWTGEVAKMHHSYGAPLSESDIKSIGAYLAVSYGSASETDENVIAASTVSVREEAAAEDVQALLASNICLSCHAIDRKVVGPAFQEVVARYAGDDQAQDKLIDSIRQGGTGKWGEIPMPPFPKLTDSQARIQADFVLAQ